jgi:tRNA nucleotidyltransferase/poly(A) polymerase
VNDLAVKPLNTPLALPDVIYDLQDLLRDLDAPVYLVGGAVRDAYLRRPIKDIDLITSGSGMKLARVIANRLDGAYYPLDSERDVGRALIDTADGRLILDAARFRGEDLRFDLEDRDFTINALALDLRGDLSHVVDPTGGVEDLKNKLLRRCSPRSLNNDPVRALRAVRQSVQFGLRIEPETLRDVREAGARLSEVSIERVRDEFFKLLALPKPAAALRIAHSTGLLDVLLPQRATLSAEQWQATLATVERWLDIYVTISPQRTDDTAAQFSLGMMVVALDRFRARLQEHLVTVWADERTHRALLALAALLSPFGAEAAEAYAVQMHLSNAERERLAAVVANIAAFSAMDEATPTAIYRYWKRTKAAGVDVILLALARFLGEAGVDLDQDAWLGLVERARVLLDAYYEQRERLVDPPALLNGTDLIRLLKIPSGRRIGELLELIREAQVNGDVISIDDALELARAYLDRHSSGK